MCAAVLDEAAAAHGAHVHARGLSVCDSGGGEGGGHRMRVLQSGPTLLTRLLLPPRLRKRRRPVLPQGLRTFKIASRPLALT